MKHRAKFLCALVGVLALWLVVAEVHRRTAAASSFGQAFAAVPDPDSRHGVYQNEYIAAWASELDGFVSGQYPHLKRSPALDVLAQAIALETCQIGFRQYTSLGASHAKEKVGVLFPFNQVRFFGWQDTLLSEPDVVLGFSSDGTVGDGTWDLAYGMYEYYGIGIAYDAELQSRPCFYLLLGSGSHLDWNRFESRCLAHHSKVRVTQALDSSQARISAWREEYWLANPPKATETQRSLTDAMLELINTERAGSGLRVLSRDPHLDRLAQATAQCMLLEDNYDHNTATGVTPFERLLASGASLFSYTSENLHLTSASPAQVHSSIMDSEKHRKNVLYPPHSAVGIAVIDEHGGRSYWVMLFGIARQNLKSLEGAVKEQH